MMILSSYLVLVLVAIFHATPSSSSPSLWEEEGRMFIGGKDGSKVEVEGKAVSYSRRLQLVKGLKPKEAAIARRGVPVMTPALEKTKARTPRRNAGAVMHENNLQQGVL
ncbi:hypothetical protein PSTT_16792 [Puccinia striiformis]|uniref:Uncharacterized protein n=1 Tax=Puccinia striiformis TaxID=27350 RepID=A0A2S4UBQ2_9BASI|nr:hypothetical protein PSTT_16792 [Puccinia striiformis]